MRPMFSHFRSMSSLASEDRRQVTGRRVLVLFLTVSCSLIPVSFFSGQQEWQWVLEHGTEHSADLLIERDQGFMLLQRDVATVLREIQ